MSTLKRKGGPQAGSDAKKPKQDGNIASFFGGPKPSSSPAAGKASAAAFVAAPEPAGPKFDKAKWVAGLTPEQKQLLKLEIDTLHESWLAHLKDEVTTKEFLELKKFLKREEDAGQKVFPPKEDVYSWSRHSPFASVKVVILGQDPYHNHNQAHGMAFSVRPPTPAPPSLKNMFICLQNDYPSFVRPLKNGGLLTPWADRGVLMLNTCLTVRAHEANSHANRGWERFTQKVIDLVAAKRTRGVVFMAWGTPAGKRVLKVDAKRHLVLKSVHPSPLSASRGFFNCAHFRLANEWLIKRYGEDGEIDWALAPGNTTKAAKPADGEARPAGDEAKEEETAAKTAADEDEFDDVDPDVLAELVTETKKAEAVIASQNDDASVVAAEEEKVTKTAEGVEGVEPVTTEA